MAMRSYGKGNQGLAPVRLQMDPDSTLETAIDGYIAAGTSVTGTLVTIATGANRQVTSAAADDAINGVIVGYEKTATSYRLDVDFFGYTNNAGAWYPATRVVTMQYTSAPSLGDSVEVYNATTVRTDNTNGFGKVINIDTNNTQVDVLI